MVDTANVPPIIGRLRLALANGRGLQAGAEEVAVLAAHVGIHQAKVRRHGAAVEAAVARLPHPDHLRAIYQHPDTVGDASDIASLAWLALALLGEV